MIELKGKLGKSIVVDGDIIKIKMGYLPFSKHRDKSILINDVASVEIKRPGLSSGFILIQVKGEESKVRKHIDDVPSENEILFGKCGYILAIKIKEYIENRKSSELTNSGTSVADELLKLKNLRDCGVLSNDEFEDQKRKILDI